MNQFGSGIGSLLETLSFSLFFERERFNPTRMMFLCETSCRSKTRSRREKFVRKVCETELELEFQGPVLYRIKQIDLRSSRWVARLVSSFVKSGLTVLLLFRRVKVL